MLLCCIEMEFKTNKQKPSNKQNKTQQKKQQQKTDLASLF